jgi:hypothetical protein
VKARFAIAAVIAVLVAAFFAFVGYNKAFASLADLTRYGAWTIWLPDVLGRLVGWSEMLCAAGLLCVFSARVRNLARVAAIVLIVNQLLAAAVHAAHGETGALPQNALLIALLGLVAWLLPSSKAKQGKTS